MFLFYFSQRQNANLSRKLKVGKFHLQSALKKHLIQEKYVITNASQVTVCLALHKRFVGTMVSGIPLRIQDVWVSLICFSLLWQIACNNGFQNSGVVIYFII